MLSQINLVLYAESAMGKLLSNVVLLSGLVYFTCGILSEGFQVISCTRHHSGGTGTLNIQPRRLYHHASTLYQSRQDTSVTVNQEDTTEKELSDVDYRVLQSMLQDSKVDMKTEEDIKKLLERGTVKTTKSSSQDQNARDESTSGEYSSTIMSKFTDTKFWKKVSRQANDILESAKIWVSNKVESDLKVLAALGIFALDRAARDVARALPAAAPKQIFQLTNTSAYEDPVKRKSAAESMNRPSDEIKAVSQEIFDILSGASIATDKSKGLRTAAPSGSAYMADRQNRAFVQKRKLEKKKNDISRVAGSLMDTAYELNQDLRAESNPAGYKSQQVRNALEAGVETTGRAFRAAKEAARLAAAERKAKQLKEFTTESTNVFFANDVSSKETSDANYILASRVRVEAQTVISNLRQCIISPKDTWLYDVKLDVSSDTGMAKLVEEAEVRELITSMISTQEDLQSTFSDLGEVAYDVLLGEVKRVVQMVYQLRARAATSVSFDAAEKLLASLFRDCEILPDLSEVERVVVQNVESYNGYFEDNLNSGAFEEEVKTSDAGYVVDVVPEGFVANEGSSTSPEAVNGDVDALKEDLRAVAAELVLESEFEDQRIENTKRVEDSTEDTTKESNVLTVAFLRSIDVLLFVLEKTFTVAVPRFLETGKIAASRIDETLREGRGSIGWKSISKASARGRY